MNWPRDSQRTMTSEASPWELTPKSLTSFVSTHLRHGDHFADEVAQVLRNLVLYITKQASYSIARTSVSGDLVSGTTSTQEDAEFQLSLYLSDFRSIGDYRKGIQAVLAQTRDLLKAGGVHDAVKLRGQESLKDGAVQVRIMVNNEWYDGTVMPAVDLIGANPSKSVKETMYRQFMQDTDKLPYQATLSDIRHRFNQSLPQNVKDLILMVKYWRRNWLRLRRDKPNGRFFELFVVHCWEGSGAGEGFGLAAGLKEVLLLLSDWKNIKITWDESERRAYPRRVSDEKWRKILASKDYDEPFALDPIDPYPEYCEGVKIFTWDDISRTVRETLLEPLFQALPADSKW
ncbi:2'-5'-oligoadenylate synthase 3-like isoform X2 [Asterias amurensis]|uniref:2'-5'-oligoadenylate synthase 3-like isoform X2 n=1 Tax=Asterias amurensis TaxID=7602 RepID=UPI003AB88DDE